MNVPALRSAHNGLALAALLVGYAITHDRARGEAVRRIVLTTTVTVSNILGRLTAIVERVSRPHRPDTDSRPVQSYV